MADRLNDLSARNLLKTIEPLMTRIGRTTIEATVAELDGKDVSPYKHAIKADVDIVMFLLGVKPNGR